MTYCSVVAVLALVGLAKRFGHSAILKILSLRSPRPISLHVQNGPLVIKV